MDRSKIVFTRAGHPHPTVGGSVSSTDAGPSRPQVARLEAGLNPILLLHAPMVSVRATRRGDGCGYTWADKKSALFGRGISPTVGACELLYFFSCGRVCRSIAFCRTIVATATVVATALAAFAIAFAASILCRCCRS